MLVLAGTRLAPLRADNPDFDLLGPSWLAVLAFTGLGLFQGMLVFALAARMSRSSPSPAGLAERGSAILSAGRIAVAAVFLVALPGFVTSVADIL